MKQADKKVSVFLFAQIAASLPVELLVGLHEIAHLIRLGHAQAHPVAERRKRPANSDVVFQEACLNPAMSLTSFDKREIAIGVNVAYARLA